jgi:hypothetical protein
MKKPANTNGVHAPETQADRVNERFVGESVETRDLPLAAPSAAPPQWDAKTAVATVNGIALTRAIDHCGFARLLGVLIDGREVGGVAYGQREEFFLPPGIHFVEVCMDWCRSKPYEVCVQPGEIVELEGGMRLRGWAWHWGLLSAFLAPGSMFMIRPNHGRGPRPRLRHLALQELALVLAWLAGFLLVLALIWATCAVGTSIATGDDPLAKLALRSLGGAVAIAFAVGLALVVRGTIRRRGRWGINLSPVFCPRCRERAPAIRDPRNRWQALWGGSTCGKCGLEFDKWGQAVASNDGLR